MIQSRVQRKGNANVRVIGEFNWLFTIFACALTFWKGSSFIKYGEQGNTGAINDNLAFVAEIHRHTSADITLDLACTPFGVLWMPYQHPGR